MHRSESRPAGIVALTMSVFLVALATLLTVHPAAADTYTVTSTQCEGTGSITEAMGLANANTGVEDTITFTQGLQVEAFGCPIQPACLNSITCYILNAEESVIFEGNGASIVGQISYIDTSGIDRAGVDCTERQDLVTALTPGFVAVGTYGQSNAGVTVTIRDLTMEELGSVAAINEDAELIIEDSSFSRIWSLPEPGDCKWPAIYAWSGASFSASNTVWEDMFNDGTPFQGFAFLGFIAGSDAGDLTIVNSKFTDAETAGAIYWTAPANREINIVSSRFDDTGGFNFGGAAVSNIVNSIWSDSGTSTDEDDRIINSSSGEMNIIASTLLFASTDCGSLCFSYREKGLLFRLSTAGKINLIGSAIGVTFPNFVGPFGYKQVLDTDTADPLSAPFVFTADDKTWIQPTGVTLPGANEQDAATLRAITEQPNLLTTAPGLPSDPDIALGQVARAEPLAELLDRIADADCTEANELTNPIDGSCITEDALGHERVDGNGRRNIGAVQLNEAPHLSVITVGDGTVDLAWTKPRDVAGLCGYRLTYREVGTTNDVSVDINDPDTLSYQVTGLTNGVDYEFEVEGLVDCATTPAVSGFPSNLVTAMPLGTIQAPSVTATPSACQTHLAWTVPDAGGETIDHYNASYRVVGDTDWTIATAFTTDLEFNVTGLTAETDYEFGVRAITTSGATGERGTVQATTTKAGDIDGSGTVTYSGDRPLFLAANGSSQGDANYEPNADLDCDGRVTPADYRLWYKAWIADGRVR